MDDTGSRAEPVGGVPRGPADPDATLTQLSAGGQLGPYRLEALIGEGGMGQVFRAIDTRLGREVAVKVAHAQFGDRFEREARAIARLNHPNVCTIHDVGPNYLVMEMLDGQSLATRLKGGAIPVEDVLSYAARIAEALDAAHSKGIVHRDLKPGNIMVTASGIKVLDFGLAKLAALGDETVTMTNTIAGTPAYMAPEQFEGGNVDGRADLFALGMILYEMAAGRRPYPGASFGGMMAKDESTPLTPASSIRRGLPRGLDAIISRLLQRRPEQRHQSVGELRLDLWKLSRPTGYRSRVAAVVMLGLAATAFERWLDPFGTKPTAAPEYSRLTNFPDAVHSPALSKDGKMLAFLRGPIPFLGGPGELLLKVLPDGEPISLVRDQELKIAPVFSPDGSRIVYTAANRNWSSMTVPISGGTPTLMMPNAAALRWIEPGQVLFSEIRSGFHMGLVAASESRASPRAVYFPASSDGMAHFSERSPDGKWVLVVEMFNAVWGPCRVVPFDGSPGGRLVGPHDGLCTSAAWSPDGRWMYFSAEVNGESHLWRQRFPDGLPEQLTSGVNQEWGVAAEPGGRSLITAVGNRQSTVWHHDGKGNRQLSLEGYAYRPLVAPDGKSVLYLVRKAVRGAIWSGEIWSADLAAGRNQRLLPDFIVQNFHVSRDGRTMVFDVFDSQRNSKVWAAPLDRSSAPRRLTPEGDANEEHPLLTSTGDVYLIRIAGRQRFLARRKVNGSQYEDLRDIGTGYLVNLTPDERHAVIWKGGQGVLLYPLAGGESELLCDCNAGPIFQDSPRVSWTGDGKWLVVNAGGSMAGLGTTAVPWRAAEPLPGQGARSGAELRRLPGAVSIPDISVAPGPDTGSYAFARTAEQSNLFRIRLP